MKHIGIFLAAKPETGGTYQYNLSVLDALKALDKKKYSVTCFTIHEEWKKYIPSEFLIICSTRGPIRKIIGKMLFFRIFLNNIVGRFCSRLSYPIISDIEASNCDAVIFPSQDDLSYTTSKPSIVAIHDLMHRYEPQFSEYTQFEKLSRDIIYKNIAQCAKGILVDSELGKKHVISSYATDQKRIFVLPFTFPQYLFQTATTDIRSKYQLPDHFFFYPAQFWEHKNHEIIIRAVHYLKKHENLSCQVVFVGSKKGNFERVFALVRELNVESNIYFSGYVPNDEMALFYKNSEGLIFTSLLGPTNIPPLEAMALGCPMIISNAYAMPEQVGDAGILVNARDILDVANAMKRLWMNTKEKTMFSELAFQRSKEFSQEKFSQRLETILNKVIDGGY